MSISSRHDEPAVRRFSTVSSDSEFRYRERTRPGGYALAIAAAVAVGLALLALGSVRMTQSSAEFDGSGVLTSETIIPDGSEGAFDRAATPLVQDTATALPDGTAGLAEETAP